MNVLNSRLPDEQSHVVVFVPTRYNLLFQVPGNQGHFPFPCVLRPVSRYSCFVNSGCRLPEESLAGEEKLSFETLP